MFCEMLFRLRTNESEFQSIKSAPHSLKLRIQSSVSRIGAIQPDDLLTTVVSMRHRGYLMQLSMKLLAKLVTTLSTTSSVEHPRVAMRHDYKIEMSIATKLPYGTTSAYQHRNIDSFSIFEFFLRFFTRQCCGWWQPPEVVVFVWF